MKKTLLCLALVFSAVETFAAANWVFVDRNVRGDEYFVDDNSMQKSGDTRTFWTKTNYGEIIEDTLSAKTQKTVNCRTREIITRYLIGYDDRDNNGKVTTSGVPQGGWKPIPPDSVDEALYKYVCKK